MKILLLTPLYPPAKGGAARAFDYLGKIFQDNDTVSEVLVLSCWRKTGRIRRARGKVRIAEILNYAGGTQPESSFIWNVLVIRTFIDQYRPDLIVFHSNILPFREYYEELFKHCPPAKIYLYKTDLMPVRDFPQLTGVIYLSKNLRQKLVEEWAFPPGKLIYAPILFKPPRRRKRTNPFPFGYILYVGSVNPLKGIYELIRAFQMLKKKHVGLKLVMVGPGPRGVSYDPDVIVLRGAGRENVYTYIENARVVVLPSYSEGLPRVALEALYLKKPLIISDVVEETKCLPPSQILDKIEPAEIAGKVGAILKGGTYETAFPWEDIAFDHSEKTWNELVRHISTCAPAVSAAAGDSLPLLEELDQFQNHKAVGAPGQNTFRLLLEAAKDYTEAVTAAGDLGEIPSPVKKTFPSLEKVHYLYLLKTLDEENRMSCLAGIAANVFLEDREKKALLKSGLSKLETDFAVYIEKERVQHFFSFLLPLDAGDMLFLGEYYLRARRESDAVEFLMHGLKLLPERAHLPIYHRLLNGAVSIGEDEKNDLEDSFRAYLKRIEGEDVFMLIDEMYLSFTGKYVDIDAVLKKYLAVLEKKKKTPLEIYRWASLLKRLNNNPGAEKGFKKVIEKSVDVPLVSGAYFHLGEMAYSGEQLERAGGYFARCLELNPFHKKSKEYFDELNKKISEKR